MQSLKITWHGHSCFSIDNGIWSLVLDPYEPAYTGYPDLKVKAHAMLASHSHEDHSYKKAVQFLPAPSPILVPVGSTDDFPEDAKPELFYYKAVSTHHDEAGGSKRGKNSVHVIWTNGLKIVHMGDLGHVLTPAQAAEIGQPDLLLIPVGGYFTIDAAEAKQIISMLKPRNVAPMHYQIGYGNFPIASVEPFIKLIGDEWQIERLDRAILELGHDVQGHCYVFLYQQGVE